MFVSSPGQAGISPSNSQPPTSNAIANGPVTGGRPTMGVVPTHPRMGQSAPNLNAPTQGQSAPLSSGASLANGPSLQSSAQQQVLSSNIHPGTSHTGSAFTPVASSPHTSQHSTSAPTPPGQSQLGFPAQGQSNVQSQMPHFGQQTNYSGQTQGLSPTAVPSVSQPLSALHSGKPKRPAMPINTGPGYPGQRGSPSPSSTPPPPTGLSGSAMTQRTTPPPPTSLPGSTMPQGSMQPPSSNSPGSSMPQGMFNSPPTGYSPMGQDSQAGRPISGRRRLYPTQVSIFG